MKYAINSFAVMVAFGAGIFGTNLMHDLYPAAPRPLDVPAKGDCEALVVRGRAAILCGHGSETQLDAYLASRGMARNSVANRIGLGQ